MVSLHQGKSPLYSLLPTSSSHQPAEPTAEMGCFPNPKALANRLPLPAETQAINAALDRDVLSEGFRRGAFPPLLREMNVTRNFGEFARMIAFAVDSSQLAIDWRNCASHKKRLAKLDLKMTIKMAQRLAHELGPNAAPKNKEAELRQSVILRSIYGDNYANDTPSNSSHSPPHEHVQMAPMPKPGSAQASLMQEFRNTWSSHPMVGHMPDLPLKARCPTGMLFAPAEPNPAVAPVNLELERKLALEEELRGLMSSGTDVLAFRYRDFLTIHPLRTGERMSQYHTSLLANQWVNNDDMSEEARVIRFAKKKWYMYWQKEDKPKALETMKTHEATMPTRHGIVTNNNMQAQRRATNAPTTPTYGVRF